MRCLENVPYVGNVEPNDVGPPKDKLDVPINHDEPWFVRRAYASDELLELSLDHLFQHKVVEVPLHKKFFEASVFLFELA